MCVGPKCAAFRFLDNTPRSLKTAAAYCGIVGPPKSLGVHKMIFEKRHGDTRRN